MNPMWAANLVGSCMLEERKFEEKRRKETMRLQAITDRVMSENDPQAILDNQAIETSDNGCLDRSCSKRMPQALDPKKQKRKIKNRESAARSRARKLAYRIQLEHEISELRKRNEMLKKKALLEPMAAKATTEEKPVLRRMSSAEF